MYTSYIGKKFMEYYKEEYNKPDSYTAKEFFDEVMFPIFFDDERHLMSVKGSLFFQMNAIDGQRRKNKLLDGDENYQSVKKDPKFRLETKIQLHEKIKRKELGAHTFVGYGEMKPVAFTSGQITSIDFNFQTEEFYYSWIGQALAIGTSGFNILIDDKKILLHLFTGWVKYRDFMSQNPLLKENQINNWNGFWFSEAFNKDIDFINYSIIEIQTQNNTSSIKSISWIKIIFVLTKNIKKDNLLIHVYSIGDKTNTTIGFVNILFREISTMYELRDMLFLDKKTTVLSDYQIERMLPIYSFKDACKKGTIGLKSIEPEGLRNYIPKGTLNNAKGKDIDIKKENNFFIYKLWIIAMLNKKELLDLSRQFAAVLHTAVKDMKRSNRSKTTDIQFVKELFDSRSPKHFIEQITELIDKNNFDTLRKLVEEVSLMPRDNFPYFVTLIKFEYNILLTKED